VVLAAVVVVAVLVALELAHLFLLQRELVTLLLLVLAELAQYLLVVLAL
jgi:hypothetical protein